MDMNTTGALLMTNDGLFAHHVTNPTSVVNGVAFTVKKTYRAKCMGVPSSEDLHLLRTGVDLGGGLGLSRPAHVTMDGPPPGSLPLPPGTGGTSLLTLEIGEGKNRQVRRMLHAVGHGCMELTRVKVGGVELGELEVGEWRELEEEEVRGMGYEVRRLEGGGGEGRERRRGRRQERDKDSRR